MGVEMATEMNELQQAMRLHNYTYRTYTSYGSIVPMTLCTEHAWKRRIDLVRKGNGDAVCRPVSTKACQGCEAKP